MVNVASSIQQRPVVSPEQVVTDPDSAEREYRSAVSVAVDLETTGIRPGRDQVRVVSLAAPARPPAVLLCRDGTVPRWVLDLLSRPGTTVIGHNLAAFDLPFLVRAGLELRPDVHYVDTLVLEQLCVVSGRHDVRKDLASAVRRRLGIELDKTIDHGGWTTVGLTPEQVLYCANDVALLHALADAQLARVRELSLVQAMSLERSVSPVVASMVAAGMPILVDRLASEVERRRAEAKEVVEKLAAFGVQNPRSGPQVLSALNSRFGLNLERTDAETLNVVAASGSPAAEVVRLVQLARRDLKRDMYDANWCAKYIDPDNRVRAKYWQLGTASGRFSSSEPNLQQVPRDMRHVFGHELGSGYSIVSIDYSQIEVLIAAVLFQDPRLLADVRSSDVHTSVASQMFRVPPDQVSKPQRTAAKAAVFTALFAGGVPGIARTAVTLGHSLSNDEARRLLDTFYTTYPVVARRIDRVRRETAIRRARGVSYTVRVPGGPARALFNPDELTASTVINTIVQGTAAVGLKCAMRRVWEQFPTALVGCVHDELVLSVPVDSAVDVAQVASSIMESEMEALLGIRPRTSVSIGYAWGENNVERVVHVNGG